MRKTTITVLSAAIILAASFAIAQPGPGGPGGPRGDGPNQGMLPAGSGLVEYLALDDAQIEAWTAYHEEFRATVDPIRETMRDLHTQLREALDAETSDAATIGQLMLDIEAVRDEIFAARHALDENLKSLLTADQLLKFEAFRAAQAYMQRGAGGPGGGPGKGRGFGAGNGPGNGPCS
jgi:Spy/CpxP family protein refolding chaperone